jgi:CDP-2,3-bis-(O-geranylgeranyl)-sn-glycerol synthase
MHPYLVLELLVLLVIANGAPLVGKKIFGDAFSWPIDGGVRLADGHPLFGTSKTIRGVVLALLITPLASWLLGLGWQVGILVAAGAMAGDLLSSFLKRRLGLLPSSMAIGLDHIPESLIPLAASALLLPVSLLDIVVGVIAFCVGGLLLSRLLFRLNLRDEPY